MTNALHRSIKVAGAKRPNMRRKFAKKAYHISIQPRNFEWAKGQPGGAAGYIDSFLNYERRRDEREGIAKKLAKARAKILQLADLLRKNSIEVPDDVD